MKNFTLWKSTRLLVLASLLSQGLYAQVYYGTKSLNSQASVNSFNYTEVTGDLWIGFSSDITDLTPLSTLTSVGGSLNIYGNSALTSLTGLDGLTSLGEYLRIWGNPSLTSLTGLQNLSSVEMDLLISTSPLINLTGLNGLTSVQGGVSISSMLSLTSLTGLENLSSVGAWFYITSLQSLPDLSGLENLTFIGGELFLRYNNSMTSLDGLDNLQTIEQGLRLYDNPVLTSLSGIDNLIAVGGLIEIWGNYSLTSLTGLDNLTSLEGPLQIALNNNLSSFCSLYNLMNGGYSGSYSVYGNALNPTKQQIIDAGPCNNPPVAQCMDIALFADENCQAMATAGDVDNGSYDPDGDNITLNISPEGPYDLGITPVSLTVTDEMGETDQCTATITVSDNTEPVIDPNTDNMAFIIWPPNHSYIIYQIDDLVLSVSDNCSDLYINDVYIAHATSDEPEDAEGDGDGSTLNDIIISDDCQSIQLRKERQGGGNGRVYTIYLEVVDESGNTGTATCIVIVPHNNNGTAIDDGPAYEVTCGFKSAPVTFDRLSCELKNYPNPFTGNTTIEFSLGESASANLSVYNAFGKEIAVLFDEVVQANQIYQVEFNGINLPGGIYYCRLQSGQNMNKVIKIVLMK